MSSHIPLVTAVLLGLAVCAMSASLQHQIEMEDDNSIDSSGIENSSNKIPLLEMTKAYLRNQLTMARTSSSEVLTLNLTNLTILIIIKAIILGFGFFGTYAGGWEGRSSQETSPLSILDKKDLLIAISYALGSSTDDYSCLNRFACEEPEAARQYMTVSKMLLKGAKLFKNAIGYNEDYEDVVFGLQEAIEFRNDGGSCSRQYVCKAMD